MTNSSLRIIGLTDTVTKCDCCGKSNLKKTVELSRSENEYPSSDEIMHYGSQCAVTALRLAGIQGFKNHVTNAVITKIANQASKELKSKQQNQLMKDNLVNWNKGFFCLPGEENLSKSEQYQNLTKVYPCFI